MSFTSAATDLLERSDINFILAKLTSNEGSSLFLVSHYVQSSSEYVHSMFQKDVVAFFVLERIKVNPVCAVSQPDI